MGRGALASVTKGVATGYGHQGLSTQPDGAGFSGAAGKAVTGLVMVLRDWWGGGRGND